MVLHSGVRVMVQRTERPQGQSSPGGSPEERSESARRSGSGSLARRRTFWPFQGMSVGDFFGTSPFELMRRFMTESGPWGGGGSEGERTWLPPIEVLEREGKVLIRAELPGVSEDEVHVQMTDDGIVIQGERRFDEEEQGEGLYRSERTYGQFYRLVPLPEGADAEQASAEFKNGLLEISVPMRKQSPRQRQSPIRKGESGGGKSGS